MGNERSSDQISIPSGCKLYSKMSLTSPHQQQYIRQILSKRGTFFQNQHICTASGYQFLQMEPNKISCQESKELVIFYDNFDYLLADIPLHKYTFTQTDICVFLNCMTDALKFLRTHNYRHGDISPSNICRRGNLWKLIDKTFIKNGVTAYERVLEGQEGFISPQQMERIRYGFVRESPPIHETDDVFALGMVVLQLCSCKSSFQCYKQSFIRFHEPNIEKRLENIAQKYSQEFFQLVKGMLHPQEQLRISLDELINHSLIKYNHKYSLKHLQLNTYSRTVNSRSSLKESNMTNLLSTKQQSPIVHPKSHSQQKYEFMANIPKKSPHPK